MATKQDLINEAISKSWQGWYKIAENSNQGGAPVVGADGKTISFHTVTYAEMVGGVIQQKNLVMIVYQEGVPGEESALWRDVPRQKDTARDAVQTFLEGMANVVRVRIDELDEEELYGFATVWREVDATTLEELKVFVWKDDGQPIQARIMV